VKTVRIPGPENLQQGRVGLNAGCYVDTTCVGSINPTTRQGRVKCGLLCRRYECRAQNPFGEAVHEIELAEARLPGMMSQVVHICTLVTRTVS
jgi:hypothetical protein